MGENRSNANFKAVVETVIDLSIHGIPPLMRIQDRTYLGQLKSKV
jgi:hypothetical protein